MSAFRTASGGRIDRSRPLRFTFDGKLFEGMQGDTLASALLANGVHLVGRSFKYHRPRGILTAGAEEPSALVTMRRDAARETPNLRATQVELYEGLCAVSQNRWPSLAFDLGRVNDFLSPIFPAGFYYKTFMWPRTAWAALYEPLIRAAAGLGRAPAAAGSGPLPEPLRPLRRARRRAVVPPGLPPRCPPRTAVRGSCCATNRRMLGGSLLDDPQPSIDDDTAEAWLTRTVAALAGESESARSCPHHRLRLLPAQQRRARRASHGSLSGPARGRRARAPMAGARARSRAGDRRHRTAAGVSRQRSSGRSCWPAQRGPISTDTACAQVPARWSSRRRMPPTMLRSTSPLRASPSPRSQTCAHGPRATGSTPRAAKASRSSRART